VKFNRMAQQHEDDDFVPDEHDVATGYKPPAQKSVTDIIKADAEDESLRKYKEALLGSALTGAVEVFPNDPRRVIVQTLVILIQGRPDIVLDLTVSAEELKKKVVVLKEGCNYQVKILFYVQREIVQGLKYFQKTYKAGIRVDNSTFMVGSFGPKKEIQSYTTAMEQAPSGMLSRGGYLVKSLFTDDDKHEHLKWEWKIEIKKDWE
jgi:Rho GDP-dissociation inhibitor